VLENALNAALMAARQFYEKCSYREKRAAAEIQSERLTDSGVKCRGPGAARRPLAV
jgi:hypothetical protein